jgi:hypothetical protein
MMKRFFPSKERSALAAPDCQAKASPMISESALPETKRGRSGLEYLFKTFFPRSELRLAVQLLLVGVGVRAVLYAGQLQEMNQRIPKLGAALAAFFVRKGY